MSVLLSTLGADPRQSGGDLRLVMRLLVYDRRGRLLPLGLPASLERGVALPQRGSPLPASHGEMPAFQALRDALGRFEFDAVHGAGWQAQAATGAECLDDRMHLFLGAGDGVHRAGLDALGAADAERLVDDGDGTGCERPHLRIEGFGREMHELSQCSEGLLTARRAAVDFCLVAGERLRIGMAIGETAALTLRLGE